MIRAGAVAAVGATALGVGGFGRTAAGFGAGLDVCGVRLMHESITCNWMASRGPLEPFGCRAADPVRHQRAPVSLAFGL